jgi:hypothetical protein
MGTHTCVSSCRNACLAKTEKRAAQCMCERGRACHSQPQRRRRLGADGAGEEAARGAVEGGGARLAIHAYRRCVLVWALRVSV